MLEYLIFVLSSLVIGYLVFTWYLGRQVIENLHKKVVLITGCDTGFGRLLALKCHDSEMQVLAACLTSAGVESLKSESNDKIHAFVMDIGDDKSVADARSIVESVTSNYGGLHGIVNNAGISGNLLWDDFLVAEDYLKVFNVNVLGMIRVNHMFMDLVKEAKGRVVNTASVCGRLALPNMGPYTVSKFGVEGYSDTLRLEKKQFGVSVSIVEPGFYRTGITDPEAIRKFRQFIWDRASDKKQKEYGRGYFDAAQNILDKALQYSKTDCSPVVDAYFHALTSKLPKSRYPVGMDAKTFYIPVSMLPACITDFILLISNKFRVGSVPAVLQKKL